MSYYILNFIFVYRFDQLTKEEIMNFLLVSPSLSPFGKVKHNLSFKFYQKLFIYLHLIGKKNDEHFIAWQLKMLSLLKGLGSKIMEIDAIKLLFHDFLKKHHLMMCGKSSQKLSTIDLNILCLLLEVKFHCL